MTLSLLMVTQARPWSHKFLNDYIALGASIGAEVVIGAHGPEAVEWCTAHAPKWVEVHGEYFEQLIDQVTDASTGDYLFRLDDDERATPRMKRWLKDKKYLEHPNWEFPRASLWPDEQHFISEWLYPDMQARCSTREQFKRPARLHQCNLHKRWPASCVLEHHSFLVKSKEERRALTCRYAAIQGKPVPAGEEHLVKVLPEDYALGISPVPVGELASQKVLIVGSAPDIKLPTRRDFDVVFGANGGARLAVDAGFKVDHLVTTAYLCYTKTDYNDYVIDGWKNLHFPEVFVDEWKTKHPGVTELALKRAGATFERISTIPLEDRGRVIHSAIGTAIGNGKEVEDRCSTGVFTACLATMRGATHITVAGFSRMNGHVGNLHQHENGAHQKADDAVMVALAKKVKLGTTNPQLAERLGIHHDRG